jgi:hypothetical protein
MNRMRTSMRWVGLVGAAMAAVAAAVTLSAVFGWWQVGDQSTISAPAEPTTTTGVAALIVMIALTGALLWATIARKVSARWWLPATGAYLAGYLIAVIGRTTEAEVIGANIGAGLAILFLGPLVAALLVWSLAWTIYLGGLTAPFVSPVQRPAVAG